MLAAILMAMTVAVSVSASADPCEEGYSACIAKCRRIPPNDRPRANRCIARCNTVGAACGIPPEKAPDPAVVPQAAVEEPTAGAVPAEATADPAPAESNTGAAAEDPSLDRAEAEKVRPASAEPLEPPASAATPIVAEPTPPARAAFEECEACRKKCEERSARRLYRCTYRCTERFRRTTKLDQKRCIGRCECDVHGCEGSEPGYSERCLERCPCGPPANGGGDGGGF